MVLLAIDGRESTHALLRMPDPTIISCPEDGVNGEAADFAGSSGLELRFSYGSNRSLR